ncbi:C-type isolectin Sp-CL4-like isoform X1 [Epinephelus lanceolatus]
MRLAVVTAVLLLVCILDTVTARFRFYPAFKCKSYPDKPCGGGWSRIGAKHCAKFVWSKKTFNDAQDYCRNSQGGHLVSIHNEAEMMNVRCLTSRAMRYLRNSFWIGLRKTGNQHVGWRFGYTDGSEFKYTRWHRGEPNNSDGKEHCVESNYKNRGYWNDIRCSDKKYFVCAKNM